MCPWRGRQSVLTAPFGVLQLARIVKSLQQMNAAAIKATTGKAPELPAEATDVPRAVPGSVLAAELAAQRADLEGRLAVCSSKLRNLDAAAAAAAEVSPHKKQQANTVTETC